MKRQRIHQASLVLLAVLAAYLCFNLIRPFLDSIRMTTLATKNSACGGWEAWLTAC
ncbi:MAG: hypothetical protein HY235_09125 [Acidobacteria bacterium]|nr:hypothetical protein [Acidobacteriota bacterium]